MVAGCGILVLAFVVMAFVAPALTRAWGIGPVGIGYLRLRKTEYTDEELRAWADRISPALASGADVFCYFKHEEDAAGPKMAKRLEDILRSEA